MATLGLGLEQKCIETVRDRSATARNRPRNKATERHGTKPRNKATEQHGTTRNNTGQHGTKPRNNTGQHGNRTVGLFPLRRALGGLVTPRESSRQRGMSDARLRRALQRERIHRTRAGRCMCCSRLWTLFRCSARSATDMPEVSRPSRPPVRDSRRLSQPFRLPQRLIMCI